MMMCKQQNPTFNLTRVRNRRSIQKPCGSEVLTFKPIDRRRKIFTFLLLPFPDFKPTIESAV